MAESAEHSPTDETSKKTPKFDALKDFPEKHDIPPKKILFLGDRGIGKTTFIEKYFDDANSFYRCYGYKGPVMVFEQFLVYHDQDEKRVLVRLMNFPSVTDEEEPTSRKDHYLDDIDAIVLCFAVDIPTSFANVWKLWLPEALKYYPDYNRFYLLGLKNDERCKALEDNKVPVTEEMGIQAHEKYKCCGQYMECSVLKNPEQAIDFMKTIIHDVFRSEPPAVEV